MREKPRKVIAISPKGKHRVCHVIADKISSQGQSSAAVVARILEFIDWSIINYVF